MPVNRQWQPAFDLQKLTGGMHVQKRPPSEACSLDLAGEGLESEVTPPSPPNGTVAPASYMRTGIRPLLVFADITMAHDAFEQAIARQDAVTATMSCLIFCILFAFLIHTSKSAVPACPILLSVMQRKRKPCHHKQLTDTFHMLQEARAGHRDHDNMIVECCSLSMQAAVVHRPSMHLIWSICQQRASSLLESSGSISHHCGSHLVLLDSFQSALASMLDANPTILLETCVDHACMRSGLLQCNDDLERSMHWQMLLHNADAVDLKMRSMCTGSTSNTAGAEAFKV